MTQIIYNLIHKYQWFSLPVLNSKIKICNRALKRSNIIGIITDAMIDDKKIKSSAIEMLNFVETFGLIISGLIADETAKEWLLYLNLRDILNILMSQAFNEEQIFLLTLLILEHQELYLDCFDNFFIAKHHLLIHYPNILLWTLRFESFHQIMKQTSKKSRNRINLLQTFSIKNVLLNANLLVKSHIAKT